MDSVESHFGKKLSSFFAEVGSILSNSASKFIVDPNEKSTSDLNLGKTWLPISMRFETVKL
jgi:hypothetical protein